MNIWAKNTCLLVTAVVLTAFACYAEDGSLYFDISDTGAARQKGAVIQPWKVIALEPDFGGRWVVAGDIDGDKKVAFSKSKSLELLTESRDFRNLISQIADEATNFQAEEAEADRKN